MPFLPVIVIAALLTAQSGPPPKAGKIVEVDDGDVIVVRDRANIRVVRRMEADVRVIYNAAQRWIVVLLDQSAAGTPPDGRVDITYTFNELTGTWPLGERWEGRVTTDDYSLPGEIGSAGIGVMTPGGLVQILWGRRTAQGLSQAAMFQDAGASVTMISMGGGRGGGGSETFDEAERRQTAVAARNAANLPPGAPQFNSSVNLRVEGALPAETSYPSRIPPPAAPVRVGGNIRTPARIEYAEPVMPEAARQAGIRGVVILEITIGADGRISDAKVLRSIPLLDAAALEAARKWRYEPTFLNGMAVPVILTATVNFP